MSITEDMTVGVLIGGDVVSIAPEATLLDAADALADQDVGLLVVRDGERVVGVVSDRDLVRAMAARRDPAATTVADVAPTNLVWADVSATVQEVAAEMMDQWVRHVLIEEEGALVGVVSARDLLGLVAASALDEE